jgi:ABC-type multidrug transport system fused ATPase/permease subunit
MKSTSKLIKLYFHYVSKVKLEYILSIICALFIAVATVLKPLFLGKIVENIKSPEASFRYLIFFMLAFFFADILAAIRDYFADIVTSKQLHQTTRLDYMGKLLDADYEYHMNKSSGEFISLNKRILTVFFELYWNINLWIFEIIIGFALTIYYLASVDFVLGLIMFLSILLSFLITIPSIKKNIKLRIDSNNKDDIANGIIADELISFETVKLFGQENNERKRLKNALKNWEKSNMRYNLTFREIDAGVYFIIFAGSAAMMLLTYHNVISDLWNVGILVSVLGYIISLDQESFDLISEYRRLLKLNADIEKFIDVMELEPRIKDKENALVLKNVEGNISFKDISFSYADKQKEVLHDINLDIHPDETVALVGKSGSGKTTLTKLLMRFYDPNSGNVYIDGKNIKDVKIEDLRKAIGIVPQDPILFNETIGFNISYGRPDASLEEIKEAAGKASLADFIETLPQKYDTIVGERGIKLSGGQRQRLAIARAILYNPEIIVFDEATSQLDSENERKIQEALDNLKRRKTTIIIAHRLSTVMKADRIIVFDKGRIVEEGNHTQLMRNKGIYSHLWELQTDFFN